MAQSRPDTIRIRSKFYNNDIVVTRQDSANATVSFAPNDSTQDSTYKLGRNVEKGMSESGMNVLLLVALSIPLVRGVGRFINAKERLPSLEKPISRFWILAVGFYLGMMALGIHHPKAGDVYTLLVVGITVALLVLVRSYRPARTLLLGLLPLAVVKLSELLLYSVSPDTLDFYRNGFGSAQGFSVLWLIFFVFIARSHKKQAEKERLEREAAALEKQRIEAQNAALEAMVAERTASLTRQTEELRDTLEELRVTQDQLIQSEKMASLGELTAGIAHEIQNPLNFVTNFADVSGELLDELAEEQQRPVRDPALESELLDDLRQNLTKITHHGQRAASIVRGMLEHSRASTGERLPTDL
ncbi:sensor histidine kinase, partial [Hymenobacter aerophilus]|uniref:sensor histidine kinase n=1 Tax=Hymenobacter aerophilus TaxID=119644 RepID=UPI00036EC619